MSELASCANAALAAVHLETAHSEGLRSVAERFRTMPKHALMQVFAPVEWTDDAEGLPAACASPL